MSPCIACSIHLCYWFHSQPKRCELEVARKYIDEMYRLSRPKVTDQEFPSDAHLPSTILRDRPWDMSIQRPTNPSNWLDPFLEEDGDEPTRVGKREFPEVHSVECEFCGTVIPYKTRKPIYNVCDSCKLRIVKSRERGNYTDVLSRSESVLETDDLVTPSLPSPRYGPSRRGEQVTRFAWKQMAPVDRRGVPGTRGTEVMDESVVMIDGKKRIKGAMWLREQMRKRRI